MAEPTPEETQGMLDTLLVFGEKSDTYYEKLTPEQIDIEYKRFIAKGDA